jgi:hypothetical protein
MYLLKRKRCRNKKCNKLVIRLVNEQYCMTCYQSKYYQNITKNKRKKKSNRKRQMAWWLSAYIYG